MNIYVPTNLHKFQCHRLVTLGKLFYHSGPQFHLQKQGDWRLKFFPIYIWVYEMIKIMKMCLKNFSVLLDKEEQLS